MKIILVSNQSCIEKKYGSMSSVFLLQLERLIADYRGRNHDVSRALLDVQTDMARYGLSPVTDSMNEKQVKTAIDGLFSAANPDYIAIIGAQDIVPFQMLTDRTMGNEKFIASDLPYASDAGYSTDISNFFPPKRAVTRIPDVYGATAANDLDIFIRSIDSCLSVTPQPITDYTDIFTLYAAEWENELNSTLTKLSPTPVIHKYSSPPHGPYWDKQLLHQPIHYIDLHGSQLENMLYGQKGKNYPVAIISDNLEGSLDVGTIAVVLSCFGGQLYNIPQKLSFVNTYLSNGASLLASTGIAYTGPAEDYSALFLNQIRNNKKNMPNALLQAQINYIHSQQTLDSVQQKTIAEFILYGGCSESYVKLSNMEEDMENMKNQIKYIEQNVGIARYNPNLSVPDTVSRRIREDALQGGFTDISDIKGFDIISADSAEDSSKFSGQKQYSVSMTDDLDPRQVHVFIYTVTEGKISNVQNYTEK